MQRVTITGLLALVLVTSGCEDDNGVHMGPGGDVNGIWVVQRSSGTTYLRVLPSTVVMYVESDTCFLKSEFAIQAVEGASFSVVPVEGGSTSEWTLERVDDQLTVVMGGEAFTLEPAVVNLADLAVCGGPEPDFPHPGCSNIPEIEVGGSVTGSLVEGDARWPSDDTWFDVWSVQLDAPATVTITMTADDQDQLDTYLMLYDVFGAERLEVNDDIDFDAGNYNSRLEDLSLDAGCYIIVANSYSGDDDGETGGGYSLSVQ